MSEAVVSIKGMMCSGCEKKVVSALSALDGVESVTASHEANNAVVVMNGEVKDKVFKKAIKEIGFEMTGVERR